VERALPQLLQWLLENAPPVKLDWQPLPEPDLIPYQAVNRLPVGSVLVLAPHPDDEVLGCGGLLALASRDRADARVVVVSDGGMGGDAAVREVESRQAAAVLGYGAVDAALAFWRLPDRGIVPDETLVARCCSTLRRQRPAWCLAPSPFEVHPDHIALCRAAIDATARCGVRLGFYEVGQALMPNLLVDITSVHDIKRRALEGFASQLAQQRYDEQILALNRFRAYTLGPAVTHAEAYWFPDVADCGDPLAVLRAAGRLLSKRLGVFE